MFNGLNMFLNICLKLFEQAEMVVCPVQTLYEHIYLFFLKSHISRLIQSLPAVCSPTL